MNTEPKFERAQFNHHSVRTGDLLPDFCVTPTLMSAVMYCAAMWEFQKIHFDHNWARAQENLDGAIIQGPVLGNYLARMVRNWIGPHAQLTRLTWRNHGVAPLDEQLVCGGQVTGKYNNEDGDVVFECALTIINPRGEKIVSGSASVSIPQGDGGRP